MNLYLVSDVYFFFYLENVQECYGVTSVTTSWAFLGDDDGEPSQFCILTPVS